MAEERSIRSVFVGNIPYEATEEQLREIFCQAGPVVSFRLVYDRETGKPKGYGFCEYQDTETAQSAMRNLNNHDFHGRPLRVGVAAGDQAKEDAGRVGMGNQTFENPYGDPVEPDKAPETVSRAVASLPPEQMYELMKQMKMCIQNNPNEARNMLIQNPQLAYGLLQAQIVMKIVDPQVALAMLHRPAEQIPPLVPSKKLDDNVEQSKVPNDFNNDGKMGGPNKMNRGLLGDMPNQGSRIMGSPPFLENKNHPAPNRLPPPPQPQQQQQQQIPPQHEAMIPPPFNHHHQEPSRQPDIQQQQHQQQQLPRPRGDYNNPPRPPRLQRPDPRMMDSPDIPPPRFRGMDGGGNNALPPPPRVGFRGPPRGGNMDPDMDPRFEHMNRGGGGGGGGGNFGPMRGYQEDVGGFRGGNEPPFRRPPNNPHDMDVDLRGGPVGRPMGGGGKQMSDGGMVPPGGGGGGGNASVQDQDNEKAALIMQVLQLSDEQIAMLPPDQRQSIIILKEQIARSSVN